MSRLVAAIYEKTDSLHDRPWTDAFAAGLKRHDVEIKIFPYRPEIIEDADLHIFWAMRTPQVIAHCRRYGQPFVCLDHGYTEDRQTITSINLNGLNGISELNVSDFINDSSRCIKNGWEIRAPKKPGENIIVVGQIHNDMSLEGTEPYAWANFQIAKLEIAGHRGNIIFKPHPLEKPEAIDRKYCVRAPIFEGSMEEVFKMARVFYTYSSTVGPTAWLNGAQAYAASPVSMIYKDQFLENTPNNRQRWLNDISFRQYSLDEISGGLTWDILGDRIIGKAPCSSNVMTLVDGRIDQQRTNKMLTANELA